MACYTPLKAYRGEGGKVVFTSREGYSDRPLTLACGQCKGCRLEKSREWALRCVHEAQLHKRNSFITLTYSPQKLPADGSLDVRAWQLFAKRVRKEFGPFRFLHCGEYGEENYRPHYHACIFGHDWSHDRVVVKRDRGSVLYSSPSLEKAWGNGFVTIGSLTWQSAAYVARYVMKKVTEPGATEWSVEERQRKKYEKYRRIDVETGEEYYVQPEYVTMSRRPGLAAEWYAKYKKDVFPSDHVVHDGKFHRPPKYYDNLLEREAPQELESIKKRRRDAAWKRRDNNTESRLRVREAVLDSKLDRLYRDKV